MDISPWLEFGWPIALLVLVLAAIGTGIGWFLKSYLKQQKEESDARISQQKDEFEARRREQDRKDKLLTEQHEFIRELASSSLKEVSAALQQMSDIRNFMQEMTRSLTILNEQTHDGHTEVLHKVDGLQSQNAQIYEHVVQLERTTLTGHSRKTAIGDD